MGDDAPVFRLKAPSERCRRRFRQICDDDGLTNYSQEDFTAEKMKAIDLYWGPDLAVQYRMKFVELTEKVRQGIDLAPEERAWVDDLEEQLFDAHKPLRVMRRKTREVSQWVPHHALAVYLAGWRNLDVPFKLDAGVIHGDCIGALNKALYKLGEQHSPDAASLPFMQLYIAAMDQVTVTEEDEKNSPAPSPPTASPDVSATAAPTPKASKPSIAAPATDSPDTSSSDPTIIPAAE